MIEIVRFLRIGLKELIGRTRSGVASSLAPQTPRLRGDKRLLPIGLIVAIFIVAQLRSNP